VSVRRPPSVSREFWRDKLVRAVEEAVTRVVDRRLAEAEQRAEQRHVDVMDHLKAWERRTRRDVWTLLEREAARTSADLVRRQMHDLTLSTAPYDTLRAALAAAPREGLALEFGVATGTTLQIIADTRDGEVYGFDWFQGCRSTGGSGYDAGEFAQAPPDVRGAELVVGLFADTLPGFMAEHPGPVAFLHVDCDLYSATKTVLEHVGPRFVEGTVVAFDEYFNFPDWEQHEHRPGWSTSKPPASSSSTPA
jgi:hypothetical protein